MFTRQYIRYFLVFRGNYFQIRKLSTSSGRQILVSTTSNLPITKLLGRVQGVEQYPLHSTMTKHLQKKFAKYLIRFGNTSQINVPIELDQRSAFKMMAYKADELGANAIVDVEFNINSNHTHITYSYSGNAVIYGDKIDKSRLFEEKINNIKNVLNSQMIPNIGCATGTPFMR